MKFQTTMHILAATIAVMIENKLVRAMSVDSNLDSEFSRSLTLSASKQLLELINNERAKNGVPAFQTKKFYTRSAMNWSKQMRADDEIKRNPAFAKECSSASAALYHGVGKIEMVFNSIRRQKRYDILNSAEFKYIAIGVVRKSNFFYVTQYFCASKPTREDKNEISIPMIRGEIFLKTNQKRAELELTRIRIDPALQRKAQIQAVKNAQDGNVNLGDFYQNGCLYSYASAAMDMSVEGVVKSIMSPASISKLYTKTGIGARVIKQKYNNFIYVVQYFCG